MNKRGTLFLVVGPSGAGKDSLIAGARAALRGDRRTLFTRRVITRPVDSGGEAHECISREAFAARRREGGFALSWTAHDLDYGVPIEVDDALAAGRNVVVNVSRAVIDEARARFAPVRVVHVTASADMLAGRLIARGRENFADINRRLERAEAMAPEGADVTTIANDGTMAEGARAFLAALGYKLT